MGRVQCRRTPQVGVAITLSPRSFRNPRIRYHQRHYVGGRAIETRGDLLKFPVDRPCVLVRTRWRQHVIDRFSMARRIRMDHEATLAADGFATASDGDGFAHCRARIGIDSKPKAISSTPALTGTPRVSWLQKDSQLRRYVF